MASCTPCLTETTEQYSTRYPRLAPERWQQPWGTTRPLAGHSQEYQKQQQKAAPPWFREHLHLRLRRQLRLRLLPRRRRRQRWRLAPPPDTRPRPLLAFGELLSRDTGTCVCVWLLCVCERESVCVCLPPLSGRSGVPYFVYACVLSAVGVLSVVMYRKWVSGLRATVCRRWVSCLCVCLDYTVCLVCALHVCALQYACEIHVCPEWLPCVCATGV